MAYKDKENVKEYQKQYYIDNQDKMKEQSRLYRINNREEINKKKRQYYKDNPEKREETNRNYYIKNIEKRKMIDKQYYIKNKEKILEYCKKWAKDNPDKREEYMKRYKAGNKKEILEYQKKWNIEKRKIDLKFNINSRMGRSINKSLKGDKAGRHWETLVGYVLNDLVRRLKKTMPEGYNWQDFLEGKLHIDHIIPKKVFNFTRPEHIDFMRCWALKNLRLLPAQENLIKGAKLEKPFQPALQI